MIEAGNPCILSDFLLCILLIVEMLSSLCLLVQDVPADKLPIGSYIHLLLGMVL